MRMSARGLVELAGHEGICLSKYRDSVGVWTIGVGATRTEIPDLARWPLDKKITMEEAFRLLRKGIRKYEDALNRHLTRPIKQTEFDALCSWCYNVGTGWVRKATVIRRINARHSGQSLYNALMMYKKPREIIGRRRKEAVLLSTGRYSNKGKALLFPVSHRGYPIYKHGKTINVWEYIQDKSEVEPDLPKPNKADDAVAEKPSKLNIKTYWNYLLEKLKLS